jgi:hypothetical protein
MSRTERRFERALAALKTIASSIGNSMFRVEDHPRPGSGPDMRRSRKKRHQSRSVAANESRSSVSNRITK